MEPEEKIFKERHYVLNKIKEEYLRTRDEQPIIYPFTSVIGGGLTLDNEIKTVEKLEELKAISILFFGRSDINGYEPYIELKILQPVFDNLYNEYQNFLSKQIDDSGMVGIHATGTKNAKYINNKFVGLKTGIKDENNEGTSALGNEFTDKQRNPLHINIGSQVNYGNGDIKGKISNQNSKSREGVLKQIIIGVVITVVGSFLVYYFGW